MALCPFGDTTYKKVFVGGLAWETQSETLHRHFDQFGGILEAVVIAHKNTGRSKGYGFVTFRDPESARRACADPSPVIDGRRANVNLASLGRPSPLPLHGRFGTNSPYFGGVLQVGPREAYVGSPNLHQPVSYGYQQGFVYPSYGYSSPGHEYVHPQSVYDPYMGQQYLQVYSVPGTVNSMYPVGQFAQPLQSGHNYPGFRGYALPGHQIVQQSGLNANNQTATPPLTIQAPYPIDIVSPLVPSQVQYIVRTQSPQFTQASGSDRLWLRISSCLMEGERQPAIEWWVRI